MKSVTLTHVARKVAATVGRQAGIRVIFRGKDAMTTGRTIVLPGVVAGVVLTKSEEAVFLGFLDHEISHVRFSDFDTVQKIFAKGPLNKHMLNILEDVRVERNFIDIYPGSQSDLDAVCEKLEREFTQKLRLEGEDIGVLNLTKAGQLIYDEAYTHRNRIRQRSEAMSDFPELVKMVPWVEAASKARNTAKCAEYSEKIVEELMKIFPQDFQKQQKPGKGKPEGKSGGEGQGSGGKGEEEGEDDAGQQGDPSQKNTGSQQGSGQPSQAVKELAQILEALSDKNGQVGQWLKGKLEEEAKDDPKLKMGSRGVSHSGTSILPPVSTDFDKIFYYANEDLDQYHDTLETVTSEVAMLKKSLHIYLKSRAMKAFERGMEKGTLDGQSVWKIRTGETQRIFKERRSVTMVDTAVCLMLDLSGSMNQDLTRMTGILAAEAILGVPKVRLEIAGFTTGEDPLTGTGGRAVSLRIPLFKAFDEEGKKVRARLGGLRTTSYTPLGEAYAYGFESLLSRKESKRVLWVVTDGEPSFPTANTDHNDYLLMARIHKKCKQHGIQVVGMELGGMGAVLKDYSDVVASVPSMSELPSAVLEMVKALVETKRGH